ncbi:hypothetical protein EYF80_031084 [Liparis tanakae]|uniref:Uncharacterized protein n=1 Tax=Liparis tanakae TaxID=230148 RepID=A0A4Z2GZJ3_9TELE|nr:hypothetical protein EYF80_031084 [Liparis tanakae]
MWLSLGRAGMEGKVTGGRAGEGKERGFLFRNKPTVCSHVMFLSFAIAIVKHTAAALADEPDKVDLKQTNKARPLDGGTKKELS